MIIDSIVSTIFICSFGGILIILIRKLPALNLLPQNGSTGVKKHQVILNAETKIKDILVFFEKQIYLHKLLSWIKVIALKIETRVDHSLRGIRKKAQQIDKKNKDKK